MHRKVDIPGEVVVVGVLQVQVGVLLASHSQVLAPELVLEQRDCSMTVYKQGSRLGDSRLDMEEEPVGWPSKFPLIRADRLIFP